MIEQLSQIQARIHTMREAVLKEGSVAPMKTDRITIPDVTTDVLWYLDRVAATVVGAHWHMSTVTHDTFLSATVKNQMHTRIIECLKEDLQWLPVIVRDLDLQDLRNDELDLLETEADELQPPLNGHTYEDVLMQRNIVGETLHQLTFLHHEVADMLKMLDADVR